MLWSRHHAVEEHRFRNVRNRLDSRLASGVKIDCKNLPGSRQEGIGSPIGHAGGDGKNIRRNLSESHQSVNPWKGSRNSGNRAQLKRVDIGLYIWPLPNVFKRIFPLGHTVKFSITVVLGGN